MRLLLYSTALIIVLSFAATRPTAAAERVDPINRDKQSVALKGYDPVAYFVQSRPAKGNPQFTYDFGGAKWHFSSPENRDKFAADPAKYLPQYGGYCSWAVSRGYTADADPQAWRIVDGKLYLNYNKAVQQKWEADMTGNISSADKNWPALHK